jgi:hypothetical protein
MLRTRGGILDGGAKSMRKTLLAALLALMIIAVGAPPAPAAFHAAEAGGAPAAFHGAITYNWSHSGQTITAQSIVNRHDIWGWEEARGRYKTTGGWFSVFVDYTRLYRNGVLVNSDESDKYVSLTSSYTGFASGWYHYDFCSGTYFATIRFKFYHDVAGDTHTSGWIVLNSNSWSPQGSCSD